MALSSAGTTGIITTSAMPFGRSSGINGRQHLDLEIVQRQVRPARDDVLTEVPLPVAGPALVRRQRLEQRIADAHGEAALRLPEHDLRHQRLAAFQARCMLWRCAARRLRARSRCGPACRTSPCRWGRSGCSRLAETSRWSDRGERICRRPGARPAHRCRPSTSVRRSGRSPATTPSGEKACAIAPVTPLRACAFAATAGNASGASPGMTSCPSFQRAVFHSLALGSVGAMPHSSSAAGHRPKRKMTRAASAAACVPT